MSIAKIEESLRAEFAGVDWKSLPEPEERRAEPRVKIAVDVEPSNGTSLGGQHVKGRWVGLVYRSQLGKILEMRQTEQHLAELESATERYEIALREKLKKSDTARERDGESPQMYFCARYPSGMPPLRACVVFDDVVPPPDMPSVRQEQAEKSQSDLVAQISAAMKMLVESQANAPQVIADALTKATREQRKGG